MKNVLLCLILLPIIVYTVDILFIDEDGNHISYIIISRNNVKQQILTPLNADINDTISISALGFRDTVIVVNDSCCMSIRMNHIVFQGDTMYVKGRKPQLKTESTEHDIHIQSTLRSVSPSVNIRQYARNTVYSLRNSSSEEVLVSINNIPLFNPSSGIVNVNMIPVLVLNNTAVHWDEHISLVGISAFAGILDFSSSGKNRINAILRMMNNGDYYAGGAFGSEYVKYGYEMFDYGDMVLSSGDILSNSYHHGNKYFIEIEEIFTCLLSNSTYGDPGMEGSRFEHAFYDEQMFHFQFSPQIAGMAVKQYLTINEYRYYNNELSLNTDDRMRTFNGGFSISRNIFGNPVELSLIEDYCAGSNTGTHSRIMTAMQYDWRNDNHLLQLKLSYPLLPGLLYSYRVFQNNDYRDMGIRLSGRKPTFNELYWTGDIFAKGNESLDNEYDITLFYNHVHDFSGLEVMMNSGIDVFFNLINWQQVGSIYMPVNNNRVLNPFITLKARINRTYGVFDAYVNFSPAVNDKVDDYYRFIEGIINSDAEYITHYYTLMVYRPLYKAGISGNIYLNKWELQWNISYNGIRYTNEENTKFFNPYMLFDYLSVSYIMNHGNIEAGIRNVFNTDYYDVRGYANEGRTFSLTYYMEVL